MTVVPFKKPEQNLTPDARLEAEVLKENMASDAAPSVSAERAALIEASTAHLIGTHDAHPAVPAQATAMSPQVMAEATLSHPVAQPDGTSAQVIEQIKARVQAGEGGAPLGGGDFAISPEVKFCLDVAQQLYRVQMPIEMQEALANGADTPTNAKSLTLNMFDMAIAIASLVPVYPELVTDTIH